MWLKFVKDRIDGLFCRFINEAEIEIVKSEFFWQPNR